MRRLPHRLGKAFGDSDALLSTRFRHATNVEAFTAVGIQRTGWRAPFRWQAVRYRLLQLAQRNQVLLRRWSLRNTTREQSSRRASLHSGDYGRITDNLDISRFEDIANLSPSISYISAGPGSTFMFIRGIADGSNPNRTNTATATCIG